MRTLAIGAGIAVAAAAGVIGPALAHAAGPARPAASGQPAVPSVSAGHGRTAALITRAVGSSRLLGDVPAADVAVGSIRLDGAWAAAVATPRDHRTDPAQVLLHRGPGQRWTVRDLGTFQVGCGIAPAAVRVQLQLHGGCGQ